MASVIRWKDSCRFTDLHPAILLALHRADHIFSTFGLDVWITSINDASHMTGSKHYLGRAVDLRTHHMATEADRVSVAAQLKSALGSQFTVIYEFPGLQNSHLHIQYNGT